ncbi:phosphatidylinositol polyphosphate 5-phosphatase type IV-like [Dreissena polymorpha]|uniref:phosphatidylinositol polyphosphate 5-phosphatase type IV-like n=1 Tax=Dreissena polymorpha TaxID=45954 RepID=UPI002264A074|nr:phosphatidylinositol polyphosphate 5-phosphatase type IV-like [Dreissena polymorpha]XP_052223167.1 phosphatidylinositol polyphosphate 5-phosphatase type IV-like [Dreissena polymorpha]XP_052223168.1 phosphatidylinositol polyphosphate 5-phosphatase type IV-like [Dreissena polymorpha]XP_052223169.1 phosphatidylinositol polyphosphate 5-phosphatase type IV-like [Dreissena polymorpha]
MDIDSEPTEGSLVNLRQKPPAKGRKKKSAAAKLAERKRRDSGGGSEFGSTASLQQGAEKESALTPKRNESKENINEPKVNGLSGTGTLLTSANKEVSGVTCGSKTDFKDTNGEINNGVKTNEDTTNSRENLSKKTSPPKPVPRKVSRRKPVDRNPFDPSNVTEGTVVSIYEKRDATRRSRKDSSSTSGSKPDLITDSDTSQKSNSKRDLFPQGEGSELKPRFGNSSLLAPSKTRGGLSSLGDLPALDGGSAQKLRGDDRLNPVPMDIDADSDQESNAGNDKHSDLISKNAPSDATVHRFRALRMTPDRSRSEESLKNAQFAPKPPSTPRSARRNSSKGEKRNREANSSDEGQDIDSKKQNSDGIKISENIGNYSLSNSQMADEEKMDVDHDIKIERKPAKGIVLHPDVKEVKDISELNVNQNMQDPEQSLSGENLVKPRVSQSQRTNVEISPDMSFNVSPDKYEFEISPEKRSNVSSAQSLDVDSVDKKGAVKNLAKTSARRLLPLDGSDLNTSEKPSLDTLGSASDLQAINSNYQKVLQGKTSSKELPTLAQNTPKPSGSGTMFDIVMPEPKPNAGKLAPIQPKNPPPPLTEDMKSQSMRVSYKTDPSYPLPKYFARSVSGGSTDRSKFETMSMRSNFALSAIPSLATKDARDRMRSHGGTSLLSSLELDRLFPDRKIGLWAGTWNMAEMKECKAQLDDFLLPEASEFVQDIYAIGTQENAMNKKEWEITLQETIGPSHVLFHSVSHGALHLAVYIRRDLIWFCTVPEEDIVQTRAVTMVKTKGALAIGFHLFGTSFLFVNCHFAPGDEKKKERLDDFMKITKQLNLPRQNVNGSPNSSSSDVTTRYDCVFWMGDLNFRIEVYKGKQAVEDIVKYIEEQEHKNFEDLVAGDQLTKLIVEGKVFQGFQEGRINFRPTYKYDIGENTFDTSYKNRIPSYTDRVLFRAKKKNSIACTHYDSARSILISDHRPVFAIFEAAVQPARDCSLPLAAGQFDRSVYTEANKRRSMKIDVVNTLQNEKSSKTCVIQ